MNTIETTPAAPEQKPGYVYMLRCGNNSLYTGWTDDLAKRLAAHKSGRGARYTRAFGVKGLAYACKLSCKSEAMKAEAALKKLPKRKKEELAAQWAEKHHPAEFLSEKDKDLLNL